MAIVVAERWSGRKLGRGGNWGASVEYVITGTDSDTAAANAMSTYLSTNSLLVWDTSIPYQATDLEQIADQIWIATVTYGFQNQQNQSQTEYAFDTGGGTQRVTQSASTMTVTAYGTNPPNFQGAINVDDNSVNGLDIVVPVYNFSETRYMNDSAVDGSYKQTLFLLTGKVNNASWQGYSQGEVLFLGASGSKHGRTGVWEIAFKFAASPNKTGIQIGSITGIAKKGWEYLWVRYEKSTDQNVLVQIPKSVYVHQVYEYGNFSGLGF